MDDKNQFTTPGSSFSVEGFKTCLELFIQHNKSLKSYLPGGLDSSPDTKVTDGPGQQKTQSQLPSYAA